MESLIRLVSQSLARQGLEGRSDYRRLPWSHWFRCESHHSLQVVPSKPGVFAIAEEVTEAACSPRLRAVNEAEGSGSIPEAESPKREARRMLAVSRFFEEDDMALVLDRMLSHQNPMRARFARGRYFVRFVVIEDPLDRRMLMPEPPTLNRTRAPESVPSTRIQESGDARGLTTVSRLNSAIATTIHCSSSFPSGF